MLNCYLTTIVIGRILMFQVADLILHPSTKLNITGDIIYPSFTLHQKEVDIPFPIWYLHVTPTIIILIRFKILSGNRKQIVFYLCFHTTWYLWHRREVLFKSRVENVIISLIYTVHLCHYYILQCVSNP